MLNSPRIPGGFASKMIAAFLLVILVPTVIISISFYLVSIGIVKQNARDSARQISARTADSLSYILNIGSDTADLLYSNASIQAAARSTGVPVAERQKMDELVNSTLNNLVYSSSFVRIIYVLRETENSWGSGSFSQAKLNQHPPSTLDWVREAKEKDGQLVWQALQYDQFSGAGDNTDLVLPVGRVLKDFDTLENIGYILVCLNGHDVLEQIRSARLGKTGRFFVTDAEGRVMVADDLSRIGQKAANPELLRHAVDPAVREFEFDESGVRHYAIKQPLSNGWMLIGVVPVDEITGALDELQRRILYSSGLVTFLVVAIGLVTAGMVTRPIKQLIRQMKSVQEGNLQARTDIRSRDEIGLMSHHFNKMLQRIDQLMQQVREEQKKKKEAELRAVAHRINPHSLFNTLSTLRWLILYRQYGKAADGLAALIRLLEANMGKKGTYIELREELDIIGRYLSILELRYDLKFELDPDLEEGTGSFQIPRMLLQPLVENAVFHGFVPTGRGGRIAVKANRRGDGLVITLRDNGRGIDAGKLDRFRKLPDRPDLAGVGIGLRHVAESIRLYFDPASGFSIDSSPGEGTTVVLTLIPHRRKGDGNRV